MNMQKVTFTYTAIDVGDGYREKSSQKAEWFLTVSDFEGWWVWETFKIAWMVIFYNSSPDNCPVDPWMYSLFIDGISTAFSGKIDSND